MTSIYPPAEELEARARKDPHSLRGDEVLELYYQLVGFVYDDDIPDTVYPWYDENYVEPYEQQKEQQ